MEIEKKLQQINKDFFFPYWDSPKQWKDADDAALWKHLGGRGKKVPNDIFGGKPFKLKSMNKPLQRAEGSLNKRLVQAAAYDVATKNSIQMKTGFGNWHEEMEVPKINKQYHGTVHMEIGGKDESSLGQMSTMASPLDPIF